jgi:glutamate-5-semialdehyde dehydrogenase
MRVPAYNPCMVRENKNRADVMNKNGIIADLGARARKAQFALSQSPEGVINEVLKDIADLLVTKAGVILTANLKDLEAAREKGLSAAMVDRLTLTENSLKSLSQSVLTIREQSSPVGQLLEEWERPNGLRMQKISVPIGVLGMIYESRPNVTIDAAALCIKSRNAVILRAGSDSQYSSAALHKVITDALRKNGLPEHSVCLVPDTDRALVAEMLDAVGIIDVLIPRGGKTLTDLVMREARMPVFAHLDGNCHVYVHASAKADLALEVIRNAKLRRTGVCGAAESLLFDKAVKAETVETILKMLLSEGVEIIGDDLSRRIDKRIKKASDEDWSTEYLGKKISCKFVSDYKDAVAHINQYGSHHTDSILAEDARAVEYFLNNVDSAIVMHNASTQFADGGEFGFGAEIGIGTGKLHARGPVGARQLTTFKYKVLGNGQIRPL